MKQISLLLRAVLQSHTKQVCLLFLCLMLATVSIAGTIKGRITDAATGEPVINAIILLNNGTYKNVSGLDGSYRFNDLPAGTYSVKVSYVSFKTSEQSVSLTVDETVAVNVSLHTNERTTLKDVTVSAHKDGAGENAARSMERNADQVMNILSGRAIQVSPDLTVANAVQRISGVTIERNSNGDGQYAILRGMDKRYNYTLVNGVKIPSPDDKYRYVPLDIFPSDLLDRLEVYKALTPSMEGDAIGGVVNMVMKDAPDKPLVQANIAGGYNELFADRDFMTYDHKSIDKKSPWELYGKTYNAKPADFPSGTIDYITKSAVPNIVGGLSLGNRFFHNKLGVIVAGSVQNTYRGSNSLFFATEKTDTLKGVLLSKMQQRYYSEQQQRYGVHTKIDYRFNDRNKLQWYNAYMDLTNIQVRDVVTTFLSTGGYDPVNGNATLGYSTRSRITRQQIYNSTLQGTHELRNNLLLQWSAVYSKATNSAPDNTTISLDGEEKNFVMSKTYVDDMSRRWDRNSDRDLAGYLNLTYNKAVFNLPVEWKIGGLYRDKQRTNFYNNYQLSPVDVTKYGTDITDYTQVNWKVETPRGAVGTPLNYDASEKTSAGYLQFKVQEQKLEVTGGVRVENTNQGYAMKYPAGEDRPTGSQVYTDVLPSLHFKYMPVKNTNIRASYFRSVNRPGFFEIVPYRIVNEDYQERGVPDLKRAIADNIDLRYEWYPRPAEQFMAGVFYKHIKDPIEYTLQPDANRPQDIYYSPGNFGTATNYGLELDFIKFFRNFGVKANYTYTHSAITTPKTMRVRDSSSGGDIYPTTVSQTRPLYGQSAHVANLTLIYKNGKRGWDAQLAGSYTGPRINTVSQFVDDDLWQTGFLQLDASVEKTFGKRFVLYAKVNNILNTPMKVYVRNTSRSNVDIPNQDRAGETLIREDYYQRSYLLGIRYKFY